MFAAPATNLILGVTALHTWLAFTRPDLFERMVLRPEGQKWFVSAQGKSPETRDSWEWRLMTDRLRPRIPETDSGNMR